jgi:hypothetical protein
MLWKAVKAFLGERTVAKIQVQIICTNLVVSISSQLVFMFESSTFLFQVLGSNYLNELLEAIDPR